MVVVIAIGAVILLESRFYTDANLPKMLPKWFQRFLKGHSLFPEIENSLKDFFKKAVIQDEERKQGPVVAVVAAEEIVTSLSVIPNDDAILEDDNDDDSGLLFSPEYFLTV